MYADRVLVAFSSRTGSTAALAEVIARELAEAGLAVDTLQAGDVEGLGAYHTVVLGSGVFLPKRVSDGGGFLVRHAEALGERAVWLFCAGPIGTPPGTTEDAPECAVVTVARAIGARGAAAFGCEDRVEPAAPGASHVVDLAGVRAWARSIAAELGFPGRSGTAFRGEGGPRGTFWHRTVAVTG